MAIPYTPIIRRDKRCNKPVITYDPIIRRKECRTQPVDVWILAEGIWNDLGIWDDLSVWID